MRGLKNKNVLITGAATGIGRAIATRFTEEGANVAINYLTDAPKDAPNTFLIQADISIESDVKAMFAATIAHFGSLDILINNAGIQTPCPSHEIETADFDRILNVDLRGAFLCAREALRHFIAHNIRGVILTNSSVHQIIPKPKYLSYAISKSGLDNLTKTLALEYAAHGIRVNAVGPGAVVTPINKSWIDNPKARAEVESHIPMGRPASPEEIASVFAFLASDDGSYITGQTIYACGGLTLYPEFRTAWASGE